LDVEWVKNVCICFNLQNWNLAISFEFLTFLAISGVEIDFSFCQNVTAIASLKREILESTYQELVVNP
jgi:hypothetical protein